ncbi:MAG: sigma factor-like helix-turn-helix DNA-binding protein [Microbacterium sp.]|uniref:sigma factor-like helix-turn-helix DNA-binding protein n=1 Tax=Microbacterium sp. TaxID=51671 RepID=UPI003A8BC7F9
MSTIDLVQEFSAQRPAMIAAAYRITGSRADAEDVVQDAWERWSQVEADEVHNPRGMLGVIVARLALNAVRARARRRETYIGPWLPEPVVDDGSPEWTVLHREGLGQALDIVLSTMTPEQATAYVLRKVLDLEYIEIARVLDVSIVAARQHVSRAQRAVSAALPDLPRIRAQRDQRALSALVEAVISADAVRVAALLAPDSVFYSDGGGAVSAARRPVHGAERIARLLIGLADQPGEITVAPVTINGGPGLLIWIGGELDTTVSLRTSGEGITGLYLVRNPEKIARVVHPGSS